MQSILRKVNKIGMKSYYESDNNLRIAVRCLSTLAVVPATDVIEAFWILADYKPEHEKMPEHLEYFEYIYIFEVVDVQGVMSVTDLLSNP